MQDGQSPRSGRQFLRASGGVSSFAADVVARLVKGDVSMTATLREDLIEKFMQAVVKSDLTDFNALKPELRRARISPIVFSDRYLPEIARRLGKAWEDDALSFAEVTMGTARLQAILRQIGAGWSADSGVVESGQSAVLLIVPPGQQHTLGAFVLLGQLRRKGVSVCLRVSPSDADLRALLSTRRFHAAMISLALPEKLEDARSMMRSLHAMTGNQLPIALGGAALSIAPEPMAAPEAVILTNDLTLAIAALGLKAIAESEGSHT